MVQYIHRLNGMNEPTTESQVFRKEESSLSIISHDHYAHTFSTILHQLESDRLTGIESSAPPVAAALTGISSLGSVWRHWGVLWVLEPLGPPMLDMLRLGNLSVALV